MTVLHTVLFYLHVSAGSVALPLFWVPVFARKGSFNHRRFGRWFARVMYAVAGTGLLMSGLDLYNPLLHAPDLSVQSPEGQQLAEEVRGWALFLLSLSILVLTTTRHGWLTINHREQREVLRAPTHLGLLLALLVTGAALLTTGIRSGESLMLVFGMLEMVLAGNMLRYTWKKVLLPREWWAEHLGGLIGSGIGAYTAFFVFGGSSLFEPLFRQSFEGMSIVLWVAPGVIGGVAITWLRQRYRRRFAVHADAHSS
jgi:hypothetical protein